MIAAANDLILVELEWWATFFVYIYMYIKLSCYLTFIQHYMSIISQQGGGKGQVMGKGQIYFMILYGKLSHYIEKIKSGFLLYTIDKRPN